MCTVFFNRKLNLLAKNRDKNTPNAEEIVQNEEFLAIKTKGSDYYSLGVNAHGCAFVSTAVNTSEWTALASVGKIAEAKAQAEKENANLYSPTKILSETLHQVKSINEWVDLIQNKKLLWKGYHIIMADQNLAVVMELHKDKTHKRNLQEKDAVVNHFKNLSHGPKKYQDYPNTFDREMYASQCLNGLDSLQAFKDALHPHDSEAKKKIWRTGHFFTISSTIIDLEKKCLYYTNSIDQDYKAIPLL